MNPLWDIPKASCMQLGPVRNFAGLSRICVHKPHEHQLFDATCRLREVCQTCLYAGNTGHPEYLYDSVRMETVYSLDSQ